MALNYCVRKAGERKADSQLVMNCTGKPSQGRTFLECCRTVIFSASKLE